MTSNAKKKKKKKKKILIKKKKKKKKKKSKKKKKKKKNEWEISVIKAVEINAFLITIFDEKDITQQLLI